MKFTTPCFIRKNTPELRKKLEEMGYINRKAYERNDRPYLQCERIFYWEIKSYYELLAEAIDCGTNEALFLALVALREDSDYMQWFVYPEHDLWHLCREENLKHIYVEWEEGEADARTCFHKASSAELIEHFKNNE